MAKLDSLLAHCVSSLARSHLATHFNLNTIIQVHNYTRLHDKKALQFKGSDNQD